MTVVCTYFVIFAFDSSKPLEPSVILSFGASEPPYGTFNLVMVPCTKLIHLSHL